MDASWRRGSKQFIDFTVTMNDPTDELTLEEVEATPFQVLVQVGVSTPDRDAEEWVDPSVEKTVVAVDGGFKVSILHMYTALDSGLHSVFVKFGPTPEEPIYQAVTFVVL